MSITPTPENEAFRGLSLRAQWLYYAVNEAGLRRCGIADLWPRRYAQTADGVTEPEIVEAARELHEAGIAVYDETADEVFFPGYIGRMTNLNNPRMVVAVINSLRDVASLDLQGVVVWELQQARADRPESPAWKDPRVAETLQRRAVAPEDFSPAPIETGL